MPAPDRGPRDRRGTESLRARQLGARIAGPRWKKTDPRWPVTPDVVSPYTTPLVMRPRSSGPNGPRPLTDREAKVARRVRRSLYLPESMSEEEVARQFRDSVAWRRARLMLAGEELRSRLADALGPLASWLRGYAQSVFHRVRGVWRRLSE